MKKDNKIHDLLTVLSFHCFYVEVDVCISVSSFSLYKCTKSTAQYLFKNYYYYINYTCAVTSLHRKREEQKKIKYMERYLILFSDG